MKTSIFPIMLFLAVQAFAQGVTKSELISKEIQLLELENNKIILSEYIKEQCDSTSCIPIYNLGGKLINDFQNSHKELKVLKEEYDLNVKAIDKINTVILNTVNTGRIMSVQAGKQERNRRLFIVPFITVCINRMKILKR